MNTSNSIFKFATIRNASNEVKTDAKFDIQPQTEVTTSLVQIARGNQKQVEKLKSFNQALNDFIKSKNFYKTSQDLTLVASALSDAKKDVNQEQRVVSFYKNLYDNIVVRILTNSNKTEVFKLLTDTIKIYYQKINSEKISPQDGKKLNVVLPEGLILSFPQEKKEEPIQKNNTAKDLETSLKKIDTIIKQKDGLQKSKVETVSQLTIEQEKIIKLQNDLAIKKTEIKVAATLNQKRVVPSKSSAPIKEVSTVAFDRLRAASVKLDKNESDLNEELTSLYDKTIPFFPKRRFSYIGENYVDVTNFDSEPAKIENDTILIYSNGCYLKFPFQVADLRVVEQKTVGYLPAEIAHINNTQAGEKQEKVTRRLKRIETFESLITEDEITKETDNQSTDKFSLEKAASDVQNEETSVNVNASASGTYGVVTASLDAGFSHSESSTNSNSSSQSYAKEIVQKVVDKVSHKVKSERSVKSIEEFEETVTHIIDNTGGISGEGDKETKSIVYRWLTKLVRATLKNYGKRLMFQIDIAHPSNYYLSRLINEKAPLDIPPDPRILNRASTDTLIKKFYTDNPNFPTFGPYEFSEQNYMAWGSLYGAKLEQPPAERIFIGVAEQKNQVIKITEGYAASKAHITYSLQKNDAGYAFFDALIGRHHVSRWLVPSSNYIDCITEFRILNDETNEIPIGFYYTIGNGLAVIIEIECKLTEKATKAWQLKCYNAIIEAYDNMKAEAENKMSDFNPNNPGLNPSRKTELIRTELKKGALQKMFRCNPFWINDGYIVNEEYNPDCCNDNKNAEKVRFLESTFDWQNMTYELHPYFYAYHDKKNPKADNWGKLLNLTDDDPHFEAFLQSSYATVRIPVYRDAQKELAAVNFILNNSIANHSTVPDGMKHLLEDLETNTPFEYIDETPSDIPFIQIKKEYDRAGTLKIYYLDATNNNTEVVCKEVIEFDKDGNKTKFYYNTATNEVVISEIKEGFNSDGHKYNYYFNSENTKIVTHRTKIEFDIEGNSTGYYSTDLGIFSIPTDLVILEKGVQNGVEVRGYPEDKTTPSSDVIIPKQFSPAIIQNE